jgi:hypothetical protein
MPGVGLSVRIVFFFFFFKHRILKQLARVLKANWQGFCRPGGKGSEGKMARVLKANWQGFCRPGGWASPHAFLKEKAAAHARRARAPLRPTSTHAPIPPLPSSTSSRLRFFRA